jgi:nitroreductase
MLETAGCAIVVLANTDITPDVWIEDCSVAMSNMHLMAAALGLGSCWIQVRERYTATGMPSGEFVHGVLDIPLQLQVLSIVAVGRKGMERKPFNEEHLQWEKIHLGKYGNQ